MGTNGHICSSCGHLSPATWEECHNCSNEFDEEDSRSVDEISNYYTSLAAGFGRYFVLGYLTAVAGALSFLVLGVVVAIFNPTGLIGSVLATLGLVIILLFVTGLSLLFGSDAVLTGHVGDDEANPGLVKTVLVGFILLIIASIVVGILLAIPIVNAIVGLVLMGVVLASPWLVYRFHQRCQVRRPESVRALLDLSSENDTDRSPAVNEVRNSSQADGGEVSMASFHDRRSETARVFALEVLADTPTSTVTTGDRDILTDHLRGDTDSAYALTKAESFVDAVGTTYEKASDTDKADVLDLLLKLGEKLQYKERFDEAQTCYEAADDLVTRLGMDEYGDDVTTELEQTAAAAASAKFVEVADELRDTVRSAEGAQAEDDHEKAVERYLAAEARLPPQFNGDPALEAEYQELVDRLESGLAESRRNLLISVLPDSPNDIEWKLLVTNLPPAVATNLEEIYDGTMDHTSYRELFGECSVDDIDRATAPIRDYRDARQRIRLAVENPGAYLGQLNNIVGHALDLDDWSEMTPQETVNESRAALTAGQTYAQTLERISEQEADTTNWAFADCLDAIKTALRDRTTLRGQAALDQAEALVDRLEPIEVYVDTFSSLSIEPIVSEITASIESGTALDPAQFSREFDRIDRLVAGEGEQLANELETFLEKWRSHPAIDHKAWRRAISEARDVENPAPLLEPYRTMQQMQGTVWSYGDLQRFSWEAFEHLTANLYTQQGYETTVTTGSRDMGVDVWAENATERLAIQVKQFARGNTVGREVIQKLESTLARGDADRIVVVTSSSFADTARRYASGSNEVELIDGRALIEKLTRYEVPVPDSTE